MPAPIPSVSSQQKQLWFVERQHPGCGLYNEGQAYRLKGSLDLQALIEAINHVVDHHAILRSYYPDLGGQPHQQIAPAALFTLRFEDMASLETSEALSRAQALAERLVEAPYDLARPYLSRAGLYKLAAEDHLFVFACHHILTDGASTRVIFAEIAQRYSAAVGCAPLEPMESGSPYSDFVAWQTTALDEGPLHHAMDYWRRQLTPPPPQLDLAAGRDVDRRGIGNRRKFDLGSDTNGKLIAAAKQVRGTPFTVLLSAFSCLMHGVSGHDDLVIGTGASGRPRGSFERTVGIFANMLPIRTRSADEMTLREHLAQTTKTYFEALEHQLVPFDEIVRRTMTQRILGRRPLVDVVFTMWDARGDAADFANLLVEPFELSRTRARFDLLFEVFARDDTLVLFVEFDRDLFDHPTIELLVGDLEALITSMPDALDRPLSAMPMWSSRSDPAAPGAGAESPDGRIPRPVSADVLHAVTTIWRQVLDAEQSGPGDDFFELGGYSMLASRLVGVIADELGVEIRLVELFENSTLEALAGLVGERLKDAGGLTGRSAEARGAMTDMMPMSAAQVQIWAAERLFPQGREDFRSSICFRIRGPLSADALQTAAQGLIDHHPILRARLAPGPLGLPQLLVPPTDQADFRVLAAGDAGEAASGALVTRSVAEWLAEPFELGVRPLIRFALVQMSDDDALFVLSQHHIVTDGQSTAIVIEELAQRYNAAIAGRQVTTTAESRSYRDYVLDQTAWLESPMAILVETAWRDELAGAKPFPPTQGQPSFAARAPDAGACSASISAAESGQLAAYAKALHVTPYMLVTAAWAAVLARWAGVDHLVIGLSVSDRPPVGFEKVVGCFVNAAPLPLSCAGAPVFPELVVRVRDAVLAAQDRRRLPFDRVVKAVGERATPARSPIFQVTSDWAEARALRLALDHCQTVADIIPTGSSRYELSLRADRLPCGEFSLTVDFTNDVVGAAAAVARLSEVVGCLRRLVGDPDFRPLTDEIDLRGAVAMAPSEWTPPAAPPASRRSVHHGGK